MPRDTTSDNLTMVIGLAALTPPWGTTPSWAGLPEATQRLLTAYFDGDWVDGTKRRPELRAARITEMINLLTAGIKQRPKP
jgi:hypothetical protein